MTEQAPDPSGAPKDPIETAAALTKALTAMAEELKGLNERLRRTRRIVWGVVTSHVFDIVLTVVLIFVAVAAHNTQKSNLALCESSNHARTQQIQLWSYVLSLGGPPKTAQQREVIAKFEVHLHQIYAPRDCQHINPGNP